MRPFLMVFLAVVFLLRGFAGDAMAIEMAYVQKGQAESVQPDCHHAAIGHAASDSGHAESPVEQSHGDCGLCCVVIGLPTAFNLLSAAQPEILVRFDPLRFHSVIPQPAFKPPVL